MAAPSKTAVRSSGGKGVGAEADDRAFLQKCLVRNPRVKLELEEQVKHSHQPVPRDLTYWAVWSYARGKLVNQRRLTERPTLAEAVAAASAKGYNILNPDGGKFARPTN